MLVLPNPLYFVPSTAPFMVNHVVEDHHAVLEALRFEGCQVGPKIDESDFGNPGGVMDPEGNRIELWQSAEAPIS